MSQRTQSARLHALAAALCALLLLVALCVMDATHAPWWALLGTQGALLVATASAGMWLDRAFGAGRSAFGGAAPPEPTVSRAGRAPHATRRTPREDGRVLRRGAGGPPSTEQTFWMERGVREQEEDS